VTPAGYLKSGPKVIAKIHGAATTALTANNSFGQITGGFIDLQGKMLKPLQSLMARTKFNGIERERPSLENRRRPLDGIGGALKREVIFHGAKITALLVPENNPQDPLWLCQVKQDTANEFDASQVGFIPIVDRDNACLEGLLVSCKDNGGCAVYERISSALFKPSTLLFDSSEAGYELRKELECDLVETVIRLV
jgi:hypothetical protein